MLTPIESKLNVEARKKNYGEGPEESVNSLSSFLSKLGDEILVSDLQALAPGHFVRVLNITPKIPHGIPVVGMVTKNLNGDARRLLVACFGLDTERAFTYTFLKYATFPLSTFQFVLQADRVTEMADALMKGNIETALSILPNTTRLDAAKEFFALNVLPAILEVRGQAENQRDWSHLNIYEIKRSKGYYQACSQFGEGPKDWKGLLINGSRFFRHSLGGELSQEEIESIVKAADLRIRELKRRAHFIYTPDALEELRVELKVKWSEAVAAYQNQGLSRESRNSAFSYFRSDKLVKNRGILALSINPRTGRSDVNYLLKEVIGATTEELFMRTTSVPGVRYTPEVLEVAAQHLRNSWSHAAKTCDYSEFIGQSLFSLPGAVILGTDPKTKSFNIDYLLKEIIKASVRTTRQRLAQRNLRWSCYSTAERRSLIRSYKKAWKIACETGDFSEFVGYKLVSMPIIRNLLRDGSNGSMVERFLRLVLKASPEDIARRRSYARSRTHNSNS